MWNGQLVVGIVFVWIQTHMYVGIDQAGNDRGTFEWKYPRIVRQMGLVSDCSDATVLDPNGARLRRSGRSQPVPDEGASECEWGAPQPLFLW